MELGPKQMMLGELSWPCGLRDRAGQAKHAVRVTSMNQSAKSPQKKSYSVRPASPKSSFSCSRVLSSTTFAVPNVECFTTIEAE